MANALKHKFTSAKSQTPDTSLVGKDQWNEEHVFNPPATGALLYGDTNQTDKASWLGAPAAAGRVLQSASLGGGAFGPAWSGALSAGQLLYGSAAGLTQDALLLYDDSLKNLKFFGGAAVGTNGSRVLALGRTSVVAPITFPSGSLQIWHGPVHGIGAGSGNGLMIADESGATYEFGQQQTGSYGFLLRDPSGNGVALHTSASATTFEAVGVGIYGFYINGYKIWLESNGNIGLGANSFGGGAAGVMAYGLASSPPTTSPADLFQEWVEDLEGGATAGRKFRDETGHVHSLGRLLSLQAGDSSGLARVPGILSEQTGSVATGANTTETDGFTYSLPASALSVNGQSVYIVAWGTVAANGNSKRVRIYFGSAVVFDSNGGGGMTQGAQNSWRFEAMVYRTGAATQDAPCWGVHTTIAGQNTAFSQPTQTLSGALTIKNTMQNGSASANDIITKGMAVYWIPE